jgi:hypothetical protein
MPTGKIARFLLVAEIASIACCCLHLAEEVPLFGIDLQITLLIPV